MNETQQETPLELKTRAAIEGKSRRQISEMLQADFWNCYTVDFKQAVTDAFEKQIVFDRVSVSALIYPKCLREHIAGLNKRSSIVAVHLTPERLEEFKQTKFWNQIERAIRYYPDDDFYIVVSNPKLN